MAEAATTITYTVALLPLLEPMAGIGIAINLAYMNLERFRYRKNIREYAQEGVSELESQYGDALKDVADRIYFREIRWLAGLSDNDPVVGDNTTDDASIKKQPKEFWGYVYSILFDNHLDMWICGVFTIVSLACLISGVAAQVGITLFLLPTFINDSQIKTWFWVLAAANVLPLTFVLLGREVVKWARRLFGKNNTELQGYLEPLMDQAREARLREQ